MKKYFNNVIVILLIAIAMSSLSACASKSAASQTAPEGAIAVASPEGDVSFPDIDLRDYTQKPDLEKLFEGYTEDYAYTFREAKFTDHGFSGDSYSLPLRQAMSLNNGDVLILFTDESWKILQNTTVDVAVDILIVIQSTKRYLRTKAGAHVSTLIENSSFSISTDRNEDGLEIASEWSIYLGRK